MSSNATGKPRKKVVKRIHELSTGLSLETLRELEAQGSSPHGFPGALSLEAIEVADEVFQWRHTDLNELASVEHVRGLMTVLDNGEPLDAVLVIGLAGRVFLVDGHHRLQAYHSVDWKQPVPVEWHQESLDAAIQAALRVNVKDKLPMTTYDKAEAAWAMVKGAQGSKADIVRMTGVSSGTVATMRRRWKEDAEELAGKSWASARAKQPEDYQPGQMDNWRAAQVAEVKSQIEEHLGFHVRTRKDIFLQALWELYPELPTAVAQLWPQETQDALEYREAEIEASPF